MTLLYPGKPHNFQSTDNSSDQDHEATYISGELTTVNSVCHEVKYQSISSTHPPAHPSILSHPMPSFNLPVVYWPNSEQCFLELKYKLIWRKDGLLMDEELKGEDLKNLVLTHFVECYLGQCGHILSPDNGDRWYLNSLALCQSSALRFFLLSAYFSGIPY